MTSVEKLRALIEDLATELEEANEAGDLEERMDLAIRIADANDQLAKIEAEKNPEK